MFGNRPTSKLERFTINSKIPLQCLVCRDVQEPTEDDLEAEITNEIAIESFGLYEDIKASIV